LGSATTQIMLAWRHRPSQTWSNWRVPSAHHVFLPFVFLFTTACSIREPALSDSDQRSIPTPSLASVESFIGSTLPASATDIFIDQSRDDLWRTYVVCFNT
jgi:hypothetical protein